MAKNLNDYDFIVAIDKSGSMSSQGTHGMTRWKEAEETALAIATKAAAFDDDGISVALFGSGTRLFESVTPSKVTEIFASNDPSGSTDTAGMLQTVFDRHSKLKASADGAKPVILIVITDGEPNDREAVKTAIRDFAETLTDNGEGDTDEFGILFLQIGDDVGAKAFLKELDDGLGAKFDIVDTMTVDELEGISLIEAFERALED